MVSKVLPKVLQAVVGDYIDTYGDQDFAIEKVLDGARVPQSIGYYVTSSGKVALTGPSKTSIQNAVSKLCKKHSLPPHKCK